MIPAVGLSLDDEDLQEGGGRGLEFADVLISATAQARRAPEAEQRHDNVPSYAQRSAPGPRM
jgi:hypothetical protein